MKTLPGLDEPLRTLDGQVAVETDGLGPGIAQRVALHPDGHCEVLMMRPNGEIAAVKAQPIRARSLIANSLARAQSTDPVRAMEVALKIHKAKRTLELDDADVDLAKEAVLADQALTNIAKAAALKVFENIDGKSPPKANRAARRRNAREA